MGNSESSSQFPPPPNNDGNNKKNSNWDQANKAIKEKEEEEDSGTSTVLKVGAAIAGTALLALGAFSLASSSSNSHSYGDSNLEAFGSRSRDHGYEIPNNPGPFSVPSRENRNKHSASGTIKIISYNVWSKDKYLPERMNAIGQLIQQHSPDIIFFQEVTHDIYGCFQDLNWWNAYDCSVSIEEETRDYFCMVLSKLPVKKFHRKPFKNLGKRKPSKLPSGKGRKEVCFAEIDNGANQELVAATSHLKCQKAQNCPKTRNSEKRMAQANQAINLLDSHTNVIFGGDFNWDEKTDRDFPLTDGWLDAWSYLRPDENGWTFDTKSNGMLKNHKPVLRKRLDRFICKLRDFRMISIKMIGTEAIPGVYTVDEEGMKLPVFPSDHYGLLLVVSPK